MNEENLVKIACTIEQETAKAILIVVDDQECWLPKSIITGMGLGGECNRGQEAALDLTQDRDWGGLRPRRLTRVQFDLS
jgi:hypothetical protein